MRHQNLIELKVAKYVRVSQPSENCASHGSVTCRFLSYKHAPSGQMLTRMSRNGHRRCWIYTALYCYQLWCNRKSQPASVIAYTVSRVVTDFTSADQATACYMHDRQILTSHMIPRRCFSAFNVYHCTPRLHCGSSVQLYSSSVLFISVNLCYMCNLSG